MPKTPGPQSGPKPSKPAQGKNGPGDGGRSDRVRHYEPPNKPSMSNPMIKGAGGAGLKPSRKHCK